MYHQAKMVMDRFTYPPLNAPTGFFTATGAAAATASARRIAEERKARVLDCRQDVVMGWRVARRQGVRMRDAMFCEWVS